MELSLPVLERVVARYRRDVNQLSDGAAPDAVSALESHVGRRLPPDLRRFLALHNGANLFRGTLRIRSTSEVAIASERAPQVVLFADGPADERWVFAENGGDTYVFGLWDGARIDPVYETFVAWLDAEVARIETRVLKEVDLDALRREIAPGDVHLMVRSGRTALQSGRPEEAEALLHEATRIDPNNPRAWQLLGDALAVRDRSAARQAWLAAFRRTRLPVPWPGASTLGADVLAALASTFPSDEDWERELSRFLGEQVADLSDPDARIVVAAATAQLSRSLVRRGRRREARQVLADALKRFVASRPATASRTGSEELPWGLVLDLVRLEVGLGHHDAAEVLLRRVRAQGGPADVARANLALAEIAVLRQEPWAEEALDDALAAGLDDAGQLEVALLRIERTVRHPRPTEGVDSVAQIAERLTKLARRVGSPHLEALTALVLGDCERIRGSRAEATGHYRRGLELAGDRDPEIRCRLWLRLAEIAWSEGRPVEAERLATAGADGFHAIELPVREAWALVRLARFVAESDPERAEHSRSAARERFVEADLAAGVAAVDSLQGDPGASLAWHLERSTAQARSRHDAQRARPPWHRSDAERPERRLGAHRLAIAACDSAVVTALAREMDACARAASVGRGRPTDPPVLRYVAAVDLLSGHRSYEAARVLLDHLFSKGIDGVMLRALQGAIARSPNAALVDGLLRCVERPDERRAPAVERTAPAVASAAELLGLRREPVALRPLVRLVEASGAPAAKKAAIVALGRIGNRTVVDAIVPALEDPRLAEQAALSLLMLGDRRGVDFHGRALVDQRGDLSGSPGEIVGRYGGPDHLLLLMRAAEGEGDRALGALQGLGLLGDPRAVSTLLKALHARDRRVVEIASGALSILSGRVDDPTEPGVRVRWHEWWEAHEGALTPGVRHREGVPFDCGRLIERMGDPESYLRRTAYDELVITSGEALPFDADGPWRVQQAHLATWRRWWSTARERFPAGRWWLDGKAVS